MATSRVQLKRPLQAPAACRSKGPHPGEEPQPSGPGWRTPAQNVLWPTDHSELKETENQPRGRAPHSPGEPARGRVPPARGCTGESSSRPTGPPGSPAPTSEAQGGLHAPSPGPSLSPTFLQDSRAHAYNCSSPACVNVTQTSHRAEKGEGEAAAPPGNPRHHPALSPLHKLGRPHLPQQPGRGHRGQRAQAEARRRRPQLLQDRSVSPSLEEQKCPLIKPNVSLQPRAQPLSSLESCCPGNWEPTGAGPPRYQQGLLPSLGSS